MIKDDTLLISDEEQQNITQQIDAYLKTTFKDTIKRARAFVSSSMLPDYFIVMATRDPMYDLYIKFNSYYSDGQARHKTIMVAKIYFDKTQMYFLKIRRLVA